MQVAATSRPPSAPPAALRLAIVIAVAHGLTDAYASVLPPLLPRIMGDLGLSITMAAALSVTFSLASTLPQPLFGYLADRYGRRAFAVVGTTAVGVFVASIGFANGFWSLALLLLLGGLGSAAFHPPGASYAVRVGEGRGGGARYSVFAFGGAFGFALGPLVAVVLVQARGMDGLWPAMIPVLVAAPLVWALLPSGRAEVSTRALPPPPTEVLRHMVGPLGIMFGISATMAFVQRAFLTMEPIIVADAGGSETLGALALTVYLGAQSVGTVVGGVLSDRMDRRKLLTHLCLFALPSYVLAVWLGPAGWTGFSATASAGFFGMATIPPIVVMAQELVPRGAAVSSGIVMGLAWATGSLGVLGTGALADVVGPRTATLMCMPAILIAIGLASHPGLVGIPERAAVGG